MGNVGDGDEERELVSFTDRGGSGKGHLKVRIADQDAAARHTLDLDRADRQAVEHARDVEADLMKTFLDALEKKLRLALFAGQEGARVITRLRYPVGTESSDGQHKGLPARGFGYDEGIVGRSGRRIVARRKGDIGVEVTNGEAGTFGCSVGNQQKCAEELVEETHVSWNDDEAGYMDIRKVDLKLQLFRQLGP